MKKNQLTTLLASLCLLLQLTIVQGQDDGIETENDNLFPLTSENAFELLNMIYCDYDVAIEMEELQDFFHQITFSTASECEPIIPIDYGGTATSSTFRWDATSNAKRYTVAYIGLKDGTTYISQTEKLLHTFESLTPQQYLMLFISECLDGYSLANIVIDDKDVFTPVDESFNDEICLCKGPSDAVAVSEDCGYLTHFTFPWANTCFGNKYQFRINNPGIANDREFWIMHSNEIVDEVDQQVNILSCSDGFNEATYEIIEPGNFWVNFTSVGAHVYITNPDWINTTVNARICECYIYIPRRDSKADGLKGRLAAANFSTTVDVWPNPFTSALHLQSSNTFEAGAQYAIVDVNGKVCLSNTMAGAIDRRDSWVNTESLVPGIYYLIIEDGESTQVEKIVKM